MHDLPPDLLDLLHDCADARRDPLDDPRVVAWLEGHPECLERFAHWHGMMSQLPLVREPSSRGWGRVAGMGGLMLAAAAAVWLALSLSTGTSDPATGGGVEGPEGPDARGSLLSSRGECLSHSTSVVVLAERRRVSERWSFDSGGARRRVQVTHPAAPSPRSARARGAESIQYYEVMP